MSSSTPVKDDGSIIASKSIQIIHKKTFKGSTLPPQIATQAIQKNTEFRGRLQTQLPQMRPLPDVERRIAELEQRAKQAEEYRAEREKVQKFDMSELAFPPDKEVPEVPLEDKTQPLQIDYVFPSRILPKTIHSKRTSDYIKESPVKIARNAELPIDPHFTSQIEFITRVKVKNNLTLDTTLEEGESEYVIRIDSQGRKTRLRHVNIRNGNTSEPILSTLLTTNELKVRARSLAYAQFKKEKREKTKKILLGQLFALKATVLAIIFCQKLRKFVKRTKGEDRTAKPLGKRVSQFFVKNQLKATPAENETASKRNHPIDSIVYDTGAKEIDKHLETISEASPRNVSKDFSSSIQAEGLNITSGDFEDVYLDMDGLKSFLDTLDKCKGLSKSFQGGSMGMKKKKKKRITPQIQKLEELLVQSEYVNKRKERKMQQEALKKAFGLDIEI